MASMTLPPDRIWDKGQRFVVQATGYPDPDQMGWQDVGYSDDSVAANRLMRGLMTAPAVKHLRILDREPKVVRTLKGKLAGAKKATVKDFLLASGRKKKFDMMEHNTTKDWDATTIYGIPIAAMSDAEKEIAFGWVVSELARQMEKP